MSTGDYSKKNLTVLLNYISKFATGGRNAGLWNGEASISTQENFIVFNFQSLLANKNNTVANAQMLLVLKWLDNEIIKNRDYNLRYGASRKIIIVIDEAHVFIDSKYPVALDFMYQMAKRIRKYNGMQIIITQNIKDFVGTEELARKSTAVINACQYSFIFPLSPNDMHDLCRLYEKAGAINESEQDEIINNGRGRASWLPLRRNVAALILKHLRILSGCLAYRREDYSYEERIAAFMKGIVRKITVAAVLLWILPGLSGCGDKDRVDEIKAREDLWQPCLRKGSGLPGIRRMQGAGAAGSGGNGLRYRCHPPD